MKKKKQYDGTLYGGKKNMEEHLPKVNRERVTTVATATHSPEQIERLARKSSSRPRER